jgi:hypothetical protein
MPTVLTATIPAGETTSSVVYLTDTTATVGIIMPAEWTPATVTVLGSADGVSFHDLHDGVAGSELAFNPRADSLVMLNPNRMRSCAALKLRSGTHDIPVVQEELRQFGIVVEGNIAAQIPIIGTSAHVIEDSSNDFHGIEQPFQAPGPMRCTVTAWLKSSDREAGFEIYNGDGGAKVYFDLAANDVYANTVYGSGLHIFDMAIEGPGPNGWWTCSASIDLTPISPTQRLRIGIDKGKSGGLAYTGDGISFIQVYQPQISMDGGANILISPDDLTAVAWEPLGATVQNFPDDILPANP